MNKIKKLFGQTWIYSVARSCWRYYLLAMPRRRLRRYGQKIIKIVSDKLATTNAHYFVDYGTMLGVVREHDFIKFDNDVDFTIVAGTISPSDLAKNIASCKGFKFCHAFRYRGQITEMTFLYKKIEVDFFFTFRHNDEMLSFAYRPPAGPFHRNVGDKWSALGVTRVPLTGIDSVPFKGIHVNIPRNYVDVLRDQYGNWETPIEGWQAHDKGLNTPRIYYKDMAEVVDYEGVLTYGNIASATIPEEH